MTTLPAQRPAATSARLHPATTVGAVHLRMNDLDLARRFYTRMLGLKATTGADGELTLSADGTTPLLRIVEDKAAPPRDPRTTGLYHFALLLPSRAELGRIVQNLVKTQYTLDGLVDHAISEAVYLTDPEGNGIELAADAPRETWAPVMERANRDPSIMSRPLDVRRMLAEADALQQPWTGISPATTMGHVHLHVRDVAEAVRFYRDLVGFDVMTDLGTAAFVSAGGYHHHLGLNVWAGPRAPKPGAVGLRHYEIASPDEKERDALVARLRAGNVPLEDGPEGPIATDPTGNRILLTA